MDKELQGILILTAYPIGGILTMLIWYVACWISEKKKPEINRPGYEYNGMRQAGLGIMFFIWPIILGMMIFTTFWWGLFKLGIVSTNPYVDQPNPTTNQ